MRTRAARWARRASPTPGTTSESWVGPPSWTLVSGHAQYAPLLLLPRDTFHRAAYLEPLGLWLVAEAGTLQSVALDMAGGRVIVTLVSSNEAGAAAGLGEGAGAPYAALRLRLEAAAPEDRPFAFTIAQPAGAALVRGAYSFAPNADPTQPTQAVVDFAPL